MPSSIEQLIALVKALKDQVAELKKARDQDEKEIDQFKLEVKALKAQVLFIQGRLSINPSRQPTPEHMAKIKEEPAPAQPPAQAGDSKPAEGPQK